MIRLAILLLASAWLALTPARADPVYQSSTIACTRSANASLAAAGGVLVAASVAGKQIYVCGFVFDTTATPSTGLQLEYAATGNCAAGPYIAAVTPAMAFAANTALVDHQTYYAGLLPVPSGNDLCLVETAGTVAAIVYFSQF